MPTPSRNNKPEISPEETKPMEMNFYDALREVFENGRTITRIGWNDPSMIVSMAGSFLCIKGVDSDDLWHPLKVSDGDAGGKDWIVV